MALPQKSWIDTGNNKKPLGLAGAFYHSMVVIVSNDYIVNKQYLEINYERSPICEIPLHLAIA